MRWAELFADLEVQLAGMSDAERDSEVAERTRIEDSRITWAQRLHGHVGTQVDLEVRSLGWVRGVLTRVGSDYALVTADAAESLLPLDAVVSIAGLGAAADTSTNTRPASRLGLSSALRALARDRAVVTIYLVTGRQLTGTPGRVGKDYLEVAVHAAEEGPRRSAVSSRRVVPFTALVLLRQTGADARH